MNNFSIKREFFLIFSDSTIPSLRFLKKGFRHVRVLCRDKFNWVEIQPTLQDLETKILPIDPYQDAYHSNNYKNMRVLRVIVGVPEFSKTPFSLQISSCVNVVRYILGVRLMAYTPYGLYKKLLSIRPNNSRNVWSVQLLN